MLGIENIVIINNDDSASLDIETKVNQAKQMLNDGVKVCEELIQAYPNHPKLKEVLINIIEDDSNNMSYSRKLLLLIRKQYPALWNEAYEKKLISILMAKLALGPEHDRDIDNTCEFIFNSPYLSKEESHALLAECMTAKILEVQYSCAMHSANPFHMIIKLSLMSELTYLLDELNQHDHPLFLHVLYETSDLASKLNVDTHTHYEKMFIEMLDNISSEWLEALSYSEAKSAIRVIDTLAQQYCSKHGIGYTESVLSAYIQYTADQKSDESANTLISTIHLLKENLRCAIHISV